MKKLRFNGKFSFKTWLYTIGRNVAIDYIRHNEKVSDTPLEDLENYLFEEDNVERSYLREERKIAVHKALRKLKAEYRQVLYLIYFEGFSNSEAASAMKRASTNLKTLFIGQECRSEQNLIRRALFMKNYNEIANDLLNAEISVLQNKKQEEKLLHV